MHKLTLQADALDVESFAVFSASVGGEGTEPAAELNPDATRYCTLIAPACGTGHTDCPCA